MLTTLRLIRGPLLSAPSELMGRVRVGLGHIGLGLLLKAVRSHFLRAALHTRGSAQRSRISHEHVSDELAEVSSARGHIAGELGSGLAYDVESQLRLRALCILG